MGRGGYDQNTLYKVLKELRKKEGREKKDGQTGSQSAASDPRIALTIAFRIIQCLLTNHSMEACKKRVEQVLSTAHCSVSSQD